MKKYFFSKFSHTSYVKLQQAYFNESNKYGSWKLIGYTAPGTNDVNAGTSATNNFEYAGGTAITEANSTSAVSGVWTANNIAKLNDCAKGATANWSLATGAVGTSGQDSYTATVADACKPLTPTFDKIGK
jgi:hypothetical protein